MLTGGSKSLMFILLAAYNNTGLTIIIISLLFF